MIEASALPVAEIVERLRSMSKEKEPGFNRFNTLALVGEGEAFVPATSTREIKSGEDLVLIPFSHGG
jgi:hypothetical protein